MTTFKEYKLGDIADIVVSNIDKKTASNQKTVKLCNFVDVYNNWTITKSNYDSFMTATASDKEILKFSLKKGQVAFTKDSETRDDIGIPAYIAEDFKDVVLGYHTALATLDENIVTGEYLNAFMHSSYIQKYFELNATGSGMRYTLSRQTLYDIPVLAPDLDTQHKIGALLSKIDRKISVNRQINRNLEELAKQIYDYWFVQFDFPNEDGKPYKSSGGKMVCNETLKRDIPEGWEVKKIESLIKENIGGDWGKEEPEGNHQLKVSCCRGADIVSMTDLPSRYILNANSSKLLEEGDLVVEISGGSPTQATGRCVLISKEILNSFDNKLICSNFCQALSISDKDCVSYFYHMWKMFYDSDIFFNFEGKTSGIKNFQYDTFVAEKWYFPPKELAIKFGEIVSKNYKKKCELDQENKRLAALRDELLPMLMNGQVKIN